jgi:hypothetical protein
MARASLDEIMTGTATHQGREIQIDSDDTILAVDTLRSWGAAFDFWIGTDGTSRAEGMRGVVL